MPILDNLLSDIKKVMKAGEKGKLACYRTLHSEIKNVAINQKIDITDSVCLDTIQKGIKQRNDSITMFSKGNRDDLVEQNEKEISWLKKYLPEPISQEELAKQVKAEITDQNASSIKNMGKVMNVLKVKLAGKAQSQEISREVKKQLQS